MRRCTCFSTYLSFSVSVVPTDVWPASEAAKLTIFCNSSCQLPDWAAVRTAAPRLGVIAPINRLPSPAKAEGLEAAVAEAGVTGAFVSAGEDGVAGFVGRSIGGCNCTG